MATTPRDEHLTGANLTGTSGNPSRTYTLAYGSVLEGTIEIHVQGAFLHPTVDYTYSAGVITFVNSVWNDQIIRIQYYTTDGVDTSSGLPRYATTLQFCRALGFLNFVPSWETTDPGAGDVANEDLGTSPGANGKLYLNHRYVILGSYTLYTGGTSSATATTAMTETTHYTLDKNTGVVTITSAGHTLIGGSNKVFAKDGWIDPTLGLDDDYLSDVLLRAEREIDNTLNTTFTNGSATNPSYPSTLHERQDSQGWFNRSYFTKKRPLIDVSSALASTITAGATTLDVTTGDGADFPTSGYVVLGTEVIRYTGVSTDTLTGLTRGALGSTAAAHTAADEIHTTIIQISGTGQGSTPTFATLSWNDQVYVDDLGEVSIYDDEAIGIGSALLGSDLHPKPGVANRFRSTYLYGYASIPYDITRLAILLAKRMLVQDNIGRSIILGRDEFRPEMFNADQDEIRRIEGAYRQLPMGNT